MKTAENKIGFRHLVFGIFGAIISLFAFCWIMHRLGVRF